MADVEIELPRIRSGGRKITLADFKEFKTWPGFSVFNETTQELRDKQFPIVGYITREAPSGHVWVIYMYKKEGAFLKQLVSDTNKWLSNYTRYFI